MTGDLVKRTPLSRWRAWDTAWQCTGEWDRQPPADQLTEGGGVTVDYANGQRKAWRVVDGRLVDEFETLTKILVWSNPGLDDDSIWKPVRPKPLPDWGMSFTARRWLQGDPIPPPLVARPGKTGSGGRPWVQLERPKPAKVVAEMDYWRDPPPELSPRCQYWARQIGRGWLPNRHISRCGYHVAALWFGVYIWEYLNVLAPLISGHRQPNATERPDPLSDPSVNV